MKADTNIVGLVKAIEVAVSTTASGTYISKIMGDANVEKCVDDRFLTILFPKPKGGGIVAVNYPLLFKSAGE